MNRHLLAAIILCGSVAAQAKDFGVKGATFPISEPSALETFMNEVKRAEANGTIDAANEKFAAKVKERVARPKVVNHLEAARAYNTFLVDMTKPLEKEAAFGGRVYPVGTPFNPLEHRKITRHLVFIDGDNEKEVAYALDYIKAHSPYTKVILWRGPVQDLGNEHKVPFYFAQSPQLIDTFKIQYTPSVVYQDGKFMRVEEIPL